MKKIEKIIPQTNLEGFVRQATRLDLARDIIMFIIPLTVAMIFLATMLSM